MHSLPRTSRSEVAAREDAIQRRFRVVSATISLGAQSVELLRPENPDLLITEEDYVRDERLPYWADIWPSAIVLARHLATHQGNGRRLLELGCGSGLVALAATRAGFLVTATDYYDDALEFTSLNVARNGAVAPEVRMVNWTALPDDLGRFDMVVASDVLYEPRYPGLVAGALAHTLAPRGEALIADPGRIAAPELVGECEARGLRVAGRTTVPFVEGEIRQTIDIIRVRWAKAAR